MSNTELLTVRETAARLGQAEGTIRRKIATGEVLAVRLGQGPRAPLRVPADWLETWLYAGTPPEREGSTT